jgi:hypothetical protein
VAGCCKYRDPLRITNLLLVQNIFFRLISSTGVPLYKERHLNNL